MNESIMVCAVCGRVLDTYVPDDGGDPSYRHTIQDDVDHPAIPVPQEQIQEQTIGRCDFCNRDHPTWVIPVRTFEMPDLPGHMSDADWAACDTCKILIVKNHWDSIVRRATENSAANGMLSKEVIRAKLVTMYNRLRKNITGEPHPLEEKI